MDVGSFAFIGFAFIAIALLHSTTGRARSAVLAILNLVFFMTFFSNILEALPVLLFTLLGYAAIYAAELSRENRRADHASAILVTIILATFIFLKRYTVVSAFPALPFTYATVGLSFILFRIIHLVVDVAQGGTDRPQFMRYMNYTLFFLSFVSGPIQRYQDFVMSHESHKPLTLEATNAAVVRVATGFLFLMLFAPIMFTISTGQQELFYKPWAAGVGPQKIFYLALAALTYCAYLYFNFSGYMHIVIGVGRCAGYDLPENFRAPWESKNFLDFWTRWHMTLSEWFKLYLFNPLTKWLVVHFGARLRMSSIGPLAFLATFGVMGIWHGSTMIFVVYGILLGAGVSLNRLWQTELARRWGRERYQALSQRLWYREFSRAFALAFFIIILSCLWLDTTSLEKTGMGALRAAGCALGAFAFTALAIFCFCLGARAAGSLFGRTFGKALAPLGSLGGPSWTAAFIFVLTLVLMVSSALFRAPAEEFVYKGF